MEHISSPIFQALFQSDVPRIILKANPPYFTIMDYNDAHREVGGKTHIDHRGEDLWKVYDPEITGENDAEMVSAAFEQAIKENKLLKLPPFRFDVTSEDTGEVMLRWWQIEILPVVKDTTEVQYLLVTTYNVTAAIIAEYREQALSEELAAVNEELAAANEELSATLEDLQTANLNLEQMNLDLEDKIAERVKELAETEGSLRSLVMTAHYPLMILRGREWVIEIANQQLAKLWDKTLIEITGNKLMDILPELEGQAFPIFLRQVYDTGIGYGEEERIFHYNSPEGAATKYVSFYYDPLLDDQGEVCGIIVAADDITAKVKQRHLMEESLTKLEESEQRFKGLIRQAPVGICVIKADDLMIQEVNDGYLELVGKTEQELKNRTIWEAIAEAAEEYQPLMNQVINTGIPFVAREHKLMLIRYGKPEYVFVDFVYEPVVSDNGIVTSVMVVAIEVTDKVKARHAIEEVEQRIRLAVEAAEIGTFEFSYLDNSIMTSERFDDIFDVNKPSSRMEILPTLHPEDRHLSTKAHTAAVLEGKMLYEARLVHSDQSIHWIRVQGKVSYLADGSPWKLLGTVLDITDFKRLQQQKDDFISIASHELKTPITSLKASLQLLQRLKDNPFAPVIPRLIDQAGRSMGKISSLVDDLLNVSRMSQDSIALNRSTFNVKQLLDDCCAHVREAGEHSLIFEGDGELEVYADEHRIDQVLVNLVNNAVKYATSSKEIYLKVERLNDMAKVSVRDQGPGIPAEKQKHLFDRYYRADESGHQVSGLGLGLYISAEIIQRHDGQIGVESEVGKGSTFWFTLPLSPLQPKTSQ